MAEALGHCPALFRLQESGQLASLCAHEGEGGPADHTGVLGAPDQRGQLPLAVCKAPADGPGRCPGFCALARQVSAAELQAAGSGVAPPRAVPPDFFSLFFCFESYRCS